MLRVLVDARSVHPGLTGIGRYAQSLLRSLDVLLGVDTTAVIGSAGVDLLNRLNRVSPLVIDGSRQDMGNLAERLGAQVFHSPLFMLPARLPCRAVATIHDVIPRARPDLTSPDFSAFFENHIEDAIRRSDAIVTVSKFSGEDLKKHFPMAAGKTHVVHEPVNPDFRRTDPELTGAVLRKLGLSPGFALFVGSMDRRKGITDLLDAWSLLGKGGKSVPDLVLVGSGGGAQLNIDVEVSKRELGSRVHALGRIPDEDLAAVYSSAAVFVFPTLYEGFGLPVLEAMACGTPVVTTNTSSLPEVAGDAAILEEPGSPGRLAEAVRRILQDQSLRGELVAKGLARAKRFSVSAQAEKLEHLYRAICGGRSA